MRKHLLFLTALVPLLLSAQRTPFTYQDMLMLDRISGLGVDPAGTMALFTVRATDMGKNKGVRSLWLKHLNEPATPEVRLAVSDSGANGAQWGADGKVIYFLSGRGGTGSTQLWKTDTDGRTAQQLTRLALGIDAYRITPDGRGAVVGVAVPEPPPSLPMVTHSTSATTKAISSRPPTMTAEGLLLCSKVRLGCWRGREVAGGVRSTRTAVPAGRPARTGW